MYKNYFQKSKVFLYPLLKISKGVDFVPVETYLTWGGNYSIKDKKFLCLYNQKDTTKWHNFEKKFLLQNILFYDYINLEDDLHLYVFDMRDIVNDYNKLCKGKYSEFTESTKTLVINFFGEKGSLAQYVEEYLYPEYYHTQYAEDLNVEVDMISKIYEVCDKPNFEKEELIFKKPDTKSIFKNKLLSLHKQFKNIL